MERKAKEQGIRLRRSKKGNETMRREGEEQIREMEGRVGKVILMKEKYKKKMLKQIFCAYFVL